MLFRQVWGGSTAISAAAFARLDLPATLDRTLSTDGAISRRANALGLRMLMRRSVLLPTPAEGGERGALGFERRQIQLYRLYAPASYAALCAVLAAEAAGLLLLPAAFAGSAAAPSWLAALAAAGLARAALHEAVTHRVAGAEPPAARLAQAAAGLLSPLAALAGLALALSVLGAKRLRWRHVDYEVTGPDSVRVLARRAPEGASAGAPPP
jgi:hypothetical protein